MADLIMDDSQDESVEKFYSNKHHPSTVLDNAYEAEDYFPYMGDGEWLSFTAAPILDVDNNVVGAVETLTVISDRKQAEQRLIESQQKYRELSTIDDLTGLFNARHFFEQIFSEVSRCNRYSQDLSLCMFDLDNFKAINDTYGHQFGNTVLEGFAKVIKANIRHIDIAFRYGGEEFVVLFPSVIADHSIIVVEKIRLQLAATKFTTECGKTLSVTTSAGLSTYINKEKSEALIKRADKAMYQAKNNGKNRTVINH